MLMGVDFYAGVLTFPTAATAATVGAGNVATPTIVVTAVGGTYNGLPFPAMATVAGVIDGVDTTPAATLEGVGLTIDYYPYLSSGLTVHALGTPQTSSEAPSGVGSYMVIASFAGSADYAAAQSDAVTLTISPATPWVRVTDAGGTYNGLAFPGTATVAGVIDGVDTTPAPTLENVGLTLAYYAGSLNAPLAVVDQALPGAPSVAGSYTVVASFAGSNNYAAAQSQPTPFTILQAMPTVGATDAGGTFSGSTFPATAMMTGVSGPAASLEDVAPTMTYYFGGTADGTSSPTAPSVPGTYTVVASFAGSVDYTPAQSSPVTLAILSAPPAPLGSEIVGDGQPGFWSNSSTAWKTGQGLDGGSLISSTANGSKQSQAAWWFSMPAGVYDISITYTAASNLTKRLGLDLFDGVGNWIGQVPINQQVAPSDFTDQGVVWKRLGSFKINNNLFHISTWNTSADGAICVDAIQLRAAPIINDTDTSGIASAGTFSTTGTWAVNKSGVFGDCHVIANSLGGGNTTASWTMPVTPGKYDVAVTWPSSGGLSTNVSYTIFDGGTKLGSVSVNQQTAPNDFTAEGVAWKSLGGFAVTGSQLKVTLDNIDRGAQVSADALRIVPCYQPTPTVNNGYPGSWINSSWNTLSHGLYGDALVSSSAIGSQQSQAAWWIPARPGTYDIQATWSAEGNLSNRVSFDLYDGAVWKTQAAVNQRNAPVGATDQGVTWQSLGSLTITGNVLHVSTWNSSTDGVICVDGVRIVPVSGLMAAGTPAATAATALLQSGQLEPIVAAAEARWSASGVAPAMIERLKQTRIVVTDLPAGYLALTEGNQILLSRDATGFRWFVDPTPAVDEEFARLGAGSELNAMDPKAVDRIDLLTVVEHEMGHILGLGDLDASLDLLMSDQLGVGIRRLP